MLLFLWQLFFIQQEELTICRAKFDARRKHPQFLRGSSVGAVRSWLLCSLLQGHYTSKASLPAPFPLLPTPYLCVLLFLWLHLSKQETVCSCCVLPGDFCLPAENVCAFRVNHSVFSQGSWITNKTDSSANNAEGCIWEGLFIYLFSYCSIKKNNVTFL